MSAFDYIRQNPDIKEHARIINDLQLRLKNIEDLLARILTLDTMKDITDTRTLLEVVPDHTHDFITGEQLSEGGSEFDQDLNTTDDVSFNSIDDTPLDATVSGYLIRAEDDADTGLYYNATDNRFEWHKDGAVIWYIDLDDGAVVSAGIDHDALTNFVAGEHHTKYTDAEAISAVEGEATLDLSGEVKLTQAAVDYTFKSRSNVTLALQAQLSGNICVFELFAKDGDGSDDVAFEIWGKGIPSSVNNRERLLLWWNSTASQYEITIENAGTGTLRPLVIFTNGNTDQIKLNPDGSVDINGILNIKTGSVIMDGSGTDDEALQLPYLTAAPSTLANGMMWMESDGLHIYRGGIEYTIAGV